MYWINEIMLLRNKQKLIIMTVKDQLGRVYQDKNDWLGMG